MANVICRSLWIVNLETYQSALVTERKNSLHNITHFRKFHCQHQCTSELAWEEHIRIFCICKDVRHFSQHCYNVSINSHNGQLTLDTDSHAGGKDNIGHQLQTTLQWNSSISETVPNKTHVHIYTRIFCLEWPISWPLRILTFPPGASCISKRWWPISRCCPDIRSEGLRKTRVDILVRFRYVTNIQSVSRRLYWFCVPRLTRGYSVNLRLKGEILLC
jgi:hypothetical protein